MPRPTGRPMREWEALDKALTHLGGLQKYLLDRDQAGATSQQIADELHALGKVRISRVTVRAWLIRSGAYKPATREAVTA